MQAASKAAGTHTHISKQVYQKLAFVPLPHASGTDDILKQFHSIPYRVFTSNKLTHKAMAGINRVGKTLETDLAKGLFHTA